MKLIAALLALAMTSWGQPLQSSAFKFFSYAPVPRPATPAGAMFRLTFPTQATGSKDVLPNCGTFGDLVYQWYAWSGTSWDKSPNDGPLTRSFTTYFQNQHPVNLSRGIDFNGALTGTLKSNTMPAAYNMQQSWFWGSSQCFEDGPEVGFSRLLFHPGDVTEQNTLIFYYGTDVNCYVATGESSCRDRKTGASIFPHIANQKMKAPSGLNSRKGRNWIYSFTLDSPTQFTLFIQDPYTRKDAAPRVIVKIDPFFLPSALALYNGGMDGYVSVTQLRQSPLGALKESPANPVRLTTYGINMR